MPKAIALVEGDAVATSVERGREVRRRLLDAAVALIAERGWSAVSTRMLAERAGVTAGLVHYHFPSLKALLAEATLERLRVVVDGLGGVLASASGPEEFIDASLATLDAFTGREPESVLFTELYLAATRDAELRAATAAIGADLHGRMAAWLGSYGVAAPAETAAVISAAIDGIAMQRVVNPGINHLDLGPVVRRLLARDDDRAAGDRSRS